MTSQQTLTNNEQDYDCLVHLEDGSVVHANSLELYKQDLHAWKSWSCSAGVNHIMIDHDFRVYSCNYKNTDYGNVFDEDFKMTYERDVCKYDRCIFKPPNLALSKEKQK